MFLLFPGQGTFSKQYGYGVVESATEKTARVKFQRTTLQVPKSKLLRPEMPQEEREELEAMVELHEGTDQTPYRNYRTVVSTKNPPKPDDPNAGTGPIFREAARAVLSVVQPRQNVTVPSDPRLDGGFSPAGGKCAHGVYIPGFESGDHARNCSVCHPFVIYSRKAEPGYKA